MNMGNGWYGMGFGGPVMWILWILLALVIFWILKSLFGGAGGQPPERSSRPSSSPLEILQKRFARGEIDEEEYCRRRKLLTCGDEE